MYKLFNLPDINSLPSTTSKPTEIELMVIKILKSAFKNGTISRHISIIALF